MAFAAIGAVASLAGTAASVGGKLKGGAATSATDAYQAQVALRNAQYKAALDRNNAIVADQAAARVMQGGEVSAEEESLKSGALQGTIKARQAANGIDVNTGSAVDVRAAAAKAGKLNAETVLSNANLTAYGYRSQAYNLRAQADLEEVGGTEQANLFNMGGSQAMSEGELGAGATLLDRASSLPWNTFGKWFADSGGGSASS